MNTRTEQLENLTIFWLIVYTRNLGHEKLSVRLTNVQSSPPSKKSFENISITK